MREIIKLTPVFKEMIWGGNKLRENLGYDILGDNIGEAWVVSAHDQGDCLIAEGRLQEKRCPGCGTITGSCLETLKRRNFLFW